MPYLLWSVLIASLLPLVWAGVSKAGAPYDNARPREVLARATGHRQRANWAQQNAWEALQLWLGAALVATVVPLPAPWLNAAITVFLIARVAHGVCYLADRPTLRSLAWLAGFVATLSVYALAALSASALA